MLNKIKSFFSKKLFVAIGTIVPLLNQHQFYAAAAIAVGYIGTQGLIDFKSVSKDATAVTNIANTVDKEVKVFDPALSKKADLVEQAAKDLSNLAGAATSASGNAASVATTGITETAASGNNSSSSTGDTTSGVTPNDAGSAQTA